jgi:hypothetical protein
LPLGKLDKKASVFHNPHFLRGYDGRPDAASLRQVKSKAKGGVSSSAGSAVGPDNPQSDLASRVALLEAALYKAEASNDILVAENKSLRAHINDKSLHEPPWSQLENENNDENNGCSAKKRHRTSQTGVIPLELIDQIDVGNVKPDETGDPNSLWASALGEWTLPPEKSNNYSNELAQTLAPPSEFPSAPASMTASLPSASHEDFSIEEALAALQGPKFGFAEPTGSVPSATMEQ